MDEVRICTNKNKPCSKHTQAIGSSHRDIQTDVQTGRGRGRLTDAEAATPSQWVQCCSARYAADTAGLVSLPRRNLAIWNEMSEDEQKGIAAGEPSEAAREAAAGLASGLRAMLTEQGIDVDAALVRKPATILV